jgi:hypothetical protein
MEFTLNERIRRIWEALHADRPTPVIMTQWGPVSERARYQAALNMRIDEKAFARVLEIKTRECGGSMERGLAEMRRCYPEAFET